MWMLLAVRDRPFWLFLFQYELSLNSQRSGRFSLLYQPAVKIAIFIVRIFLNWENALTFRPIVVPDCIMNRWLWNNVHDLSAQQYQGRWFYKDIFRHPMSSRVALCQSVLWRCKKNKKKLYPSAVVLTEKGFEVSSRFLQGHNHRAPFSEAQKTSRNPYTKYSLLSWKRKQNWG